MRFIGSGFRLELRGICFLSMRVVPIELTSCRRGRKSCSLHEPCRTSTRAKEPCDYLHLMPGCATEPSAFF